MNGKSNEENLFRADREGMVEYQLSMRGIRNTQVLDAMRTVPRHHFVPQEYQRESYQDSPLEIGESQTISQPYIVAVMVEALNPNPGFSVLEVGSGSGYAAAVLSRICSRVYGVERFPALVEQSQKVLSSLGYGNVEVREGDGTLGWEEKAPFDGIVVSAAAPDIPPALIAQLKPGGTMVIPVGDRHVQQLIKVEKDASGTLSKTALGEVRFVSLIGREGW